MAHGLDEVPDPYPAAKIHEAPLHVVTPDSGLRANFGEFINVTEEFMVSVDKRWRSSSNGYCGNCGCREPAHSSTCKFTIMATAINVVRGLLK